MNKHYFECDCQEFDHLLRLAYFEEKDRNNELYIEVHLRQKPFIHRLLNGVKYILGFRSSFGDFDEFVLNRKSALEMKQTLEEYIRTTDETSN